MWHALVGGGYGGVAAELAAGGGHFLAFFLAYRDRHGAAAQRLHEGVHARARAELLNATIHDPNAPHWVIPYPRLAKLLSIST